MIDQALHQARQPRRVSYSKEWRSKTPIADDATRKLLEEDVRARPAATVQERRRFLRTMAGKSLSEPTLRRLLKRMGFSRKKGLWGRWNGTSGEEPLGR
jgi:transposase